MQETQAMWFNPCVGKIPQRGKWQSMPVLLPENLHGQGSLARYSPQSPKESVMTEHAHAYHLQSEKKNPPPKKSQLFMYQWGHYSEFWIVFFWWLICNICFLCFIENICSDFQLSFPNDWLFHYLFIFSGSGLDGPYWWWLLMAPYAWVNIWYHEIAMFGEQRGAGSQIPSNYVYWEWIWQMWSKEKKQEWGC